jgi:hypothetical protein
VVEDEEYELGSPLTSSIETYTEQKCTPIPSSVITRGPVHGITHIQRPKPGYEYDVPPQLGGLKRALGADDWTEYLILVEGYALKEITEDEFNAISGRIFYVVHAQLREKIQNMVVKRMVLPVVEHNKTSIICEDIMGDNVRSEQANISDVEDSGK